MSITKQLMDPIDFHNMVKNNNNLEVDWAHQLTGSQHSSKCCLLCLTEERNSVTL